MDSISKNKLTAIFIQSLIEGVMVILHQVSKVGEDIRNNVTEYFRLSSKKEEAIPMRFDSSAILFAKKIKCPSWSTHCAVTDKEGVHKERVVSPSTMFMTNDFPIPPFLAMCLLPLSSPSSAKVCVKV